VTTLDTNLSPTLAAAIRENRLHYAALHNYGTFFPNTSAYDLHPNVPSTWSTVPALRHALALNPYTPWVWYLASTALIMDPSKSLTTHILEPTTLSNLILPDRPIVPPDSVIHTSSSRSADRVELILAQDNEGLAGDSLLLRSGDWAKFFLDAWFDPLYRSYNFQKAEGHALEHIVQWHGTVLAKLALVPMKALNSYMGAKMAKGVDAGMEYTEGDFVANFKGCDKKEEGRSCEAEMKPLIERWRELRDREQRKG
jgi:mannan polymerase II complex MNN11 subunit